MSARLLERWWERTTLLIAAPPVFVITFLLWLAYEPWDALSFSEYWETYREEFVRQWRES